MVPALCQDGDASRNLNPTRKLLDLARNGDQRAFHDLYHRYRVPLMRWAHGRLCASARGQNETGDLVHICLFKAFHSLDRFVYRHDGSFVGFLHEILRNEVASANRRWIARHPNVALDGEHPDSAPTPDEIYGGKERLALYERALATLPAEVQDLIRMREMGLTHNEIAEEANFRTANAARMAVARAIERLSKAVQGMMRERDQT